MLFGDVESDKRKNRRKYFKDTIFWVGTADGFLRVASKRPLKLTLVKKGFVGGIFGSVIKKTSPS